MSAIKLLLLLLYYICFAMFLIIFSLALPVIVCVHDFCRVGMLLVS